jgi:uncharacterized protein YndB with AHSA1/START domain
MGDSVQVKAGLGSTQVELELTIEAPRERVWTALVQEMGAWWRKDFYCAGGKRFVMEPFVGGRVYEDAGDGNGLHWYTVTVLSAPRLLALSGQLAPPWGGPAVSFVRIELEAAGERTRLRLSDSLFGVVDEGSHASISEGWRLLIGEGLKPHAES